MLRIPSDLTKHPSIVNTETSRWSRHQTLKKFNFLKSEAQKTSEQLSALPPEFMGPWAKWKCRTSRSKSIQKFEMVTAEHGTNPRPFGAWAMSDCSSLMPIQLILPTGPRPHAFLKNFILSSDSHVFFFKCIHRRLGHLNHGCGQSESLNEKSVKAFRRTKPPSDGKHEKETLKSQPWYMNYYNEAKKE